MLHSSRVGSALVVGFLALVVMFAGELHAQGGNNPYHATDGWEKLPDGRIFGSLSGAFPDPDGRHMWVLNRCGGDIGRHDRKTIHGRIRKRRNLDG